MTAVVMDYSSLVRNGLLHSRMSVFEPLDEDQLTDVARSPLAMLSRFSLPPLPPHASRLANPLPQSRPSSIIYTHAPVTPPAPAKATKPRLHLQTRLQPERLKPTPLLSLDTRAARHIPVRSQDSFLSFSATAESSRTSSAVRPSESLSVVPPVSRFSPATPEVLDQSFNVEFDWSPESDLDFDSDDGDDLPCSALSPGIPSPAPCAPPPTPASILSPLVRAPPSTPAAVASPYERPGVVPWTRRRSAPQAMVPHSPLSAYSAVASPPTGAKYSDVFYLWDQAAAQTPDGVHPYGLWAGSVEGEGHPYAAV